MYNKLMNCIKSIREKTDFVPEIGLILGSGLGDYAKNIDVVAKVEYSDIEGFPVSTVPGHCGRFVFGYVGGKKVVAMQGRVHYYEGYSIREIAGILNTPPATVGTRLARGRAALKAMLKGEEDNE